jgi:hypothetical protein
MLWRPNQCREYRGGVDRIQQQFRTPLFASTDASNQPNLAILASLFYPPSSGQPLSKAPSFR